jgi:hypothetical protein
MSIRRRALDAGLLALALVPTFLGGEVSAFDFSRYRPTTIRAFVKDLPAQQGTMVTTDLPIRARVQYSGEFRPLPDDSRRLIAVWTEAMNVPGITTAFRREVKITEAGTDYWVPVQEFLAPTMNDELRIGEEIELFMIYIGQINGRHLFLVNAFDHEGPHPARP